MTPDAHERARGMPLAAALGTGARSLAIPRSTAALGLSTASTRAVGRWVITYGANATTRSSSSARLEVQRCVSSPSVIACTAPAASFAQKPGTPVRCQFDFEVVPAAVKVVVPRA